MSIFQFQEKRDDDPRTRFVGGELWESSGGATRLVDRPNAFKVSESTDQAAVGGAIPTDPNAPIALGGIWPIRFHYKGSTNEPSSPFGLRVTLDRQNLSGWTAGSYLIQILARRGDNAESASVLYHLTMSPRYGLADNLYTLCILGGNSVTTTVNLVQNDDDKFILEFRIVNGSDYPEFAVMETGSGQNGHTLVSFEQIDSTQFGAGTQIYAHNKIDDVTARNLTVSGTFSNPSSEYLKRDLTTFDSDDYAALEAGFAALGDPFTGFWRDSEWYSDGTPFAGYAAEQVIEAFGNLAHKYNFVAVLAEAREASDTVQNDDGNEIAPAQEARPTLYSIASINLLTAWMWRERRRVAKWQEAAATLRAADLSPELNAFCDAINAN